MQKTTLLSIEWPSHISATTSEWICIVDGRRKWSSL